VAGRGSSAQRSESGRVMIDDAYRARRAAEDERNDRDRADNLAWRRFVLAPFLAANPGCELTGQSLVTAVAVWHNGPRVAGRA
jgi:hypothetical protein